MFKAIKELEAKLKKAEGEETAAARKLFAYEVVPAMETVRKYADAREELTAKE